MGQLRVISDHLEGKFGLPPKPWKVGRGNDCDIQLIHKSVSRHHCVLTEKDDQLRLEDLGSTYGTFVNGAQISDGYAKVGDKVRFGRIVLAYEELAPDTVVGKIPVAEPVRDDVPVAPVVPEAEPAAPANPPAEPQNIPPFNPTAQPAAQAEPKPEAPAKPAFKLDPPAPKKPAPSKPKHPPSGQPGPMARFKGDPKEEDGESEAAAKPKRAGGVFSRLQGGHKRKTKAEKNDYLAEADDWEDKAREMEEDGVDYAGEAEQWEEVWGKEKKRKSLFFLRNPLGGLFSGFANLGLKMRMAIVFSVLILGGGLAHTVYQKATAHILVPKKKVKLQSNEKGADPDKLLQKAVDQLKKSLPGTGK